MITVTIPRAVRPFCGGRSELELEAADVRGALAEIARLHPELHVRLCDERGEPRPHLGVFVNDDSIRARDGLATGLTAGDVVTILPAVSGG